MNGEISKSAYSFAAPDGLKVNMLSCAYGLPKSELSFSWVMHSGDVGDIQTGYRIFVANRLSDMQEENFLLDTGWIASDESSDVAIAGLETLLQDNELYYWAVQLRNKRGAESALSECAAFTTAVGQEWEDTCGIWCEGAPDAGDYCLLRAEFKLADADAVEKAVLSATALSPMPTRQYVTQLMINGQSVGMAPACFGRSTDGEQLIYYHSYDVTQRLTGGANVLSAINHTTQGKGFLCQLTVFYKNGAKRVLLNSARDVALFGAMDATAVYASGRSVSRGAYTAWAEDIDATKFPFGFESVGFEGVWPTARLGQELDEPGRQVLVPYPGEPVLRFLHEVAGVEHIGQGHYLIDLGHEIVGTLRLDVAVPDKTSVRVYFGEELDEYGAVRYRMRAGCTYFEQWTLRAGVQRIEGFGAKAFRFVEILDCPVELTEQNVHGVAIRQDFDPDASYFTCSNDILCALYDTYKYGVCATNEHQYVDAPCGDRMLSESAMVVRMLSSYVYQNNAALPSFTLERMLTDRAWVREFGLSGIHALRLNYLYSGNAALLRRLYPQLRKMVLANEPHEQTGLFACPINGQGEAVFAVDEPETACDDYCTAAAHFNTVYNAICYTALRDMTVMASVLGKEDEATQFRAMADRLHGQMIALLYDASRGAFRDGLTVHGEPIEHFAQHATAYALDAGVYADDRMKDTLGRTLIAQDSIRMSIQGAHVLLSALYRAGFGAYATALLASDDTSVGAHTFAAALTDGLVTISPSSWSSREQGRRALCDLRGAAPAALIVRQMFGVRPTRPGFHKFEVRPQLGDLPYASVRIPTVKGTVGVSVGQNAEAYEVEVIVPPNTKATVFLPVLPGGTNTLFVNQQISNFPIEGDCFRIELGSGTHRLLAQ